MGRKMILACLVGIGGCGILSDNSVVDIRGLWQRQTIAEKTADIDTRIGGYILLGDLDNNGRLDAASGFVSGGDVLVHIQSSSYTWTSTVVASGLGAINSLAAADIDNNDRLDIVAATGSGKVWLLWAPSFSGPAPAGWTKQSLSNPITVNEWNDVRIANFDSLPALDIVATSMDGRVIVLWRSEGLPSSTSNYEPFVIASNLKGGFERLGEADIDHDGDLDLFACGRNSGVIWLENQGPPNATLPWIVHDISTTSGPTQLVVDDFDDDGDLDVAVTNRDDGTVVWYESLGFPRTDPWPMHLMADLSPGRPNAINVGDFDNDGKKDVIAGTDTVGQSIYWLERMGDARQPWLIQRVDTTNYDVGQLPTGDIDGQGSTDFATTLADSETPVVW